MLLSSADTTSSNVHPSRAHSRETRVITLQQQPNRLAEYPIPTVIFKQEMPAAHFSREASLCCVLEGVTLPCTLNCSAAQATRLTTCYEFGEYAHLQGAAKAGTVCG